MNYQNWLKRELNMKTTKKILGKKCFFFAHRFSEWRDIEGVTLPYHKHVVTAQFTCSIPLGLGLPNMRVTVPL